MADPAIERADTGTFATLSRGEVYHRAMRAQHLAQIAAECATVGPGCDLPRAARLLAEVGAIVGSAGGEGHDG